MYCTVLCICNYACTCVSAIYLLTVMIIAALSLFSTVIVLRLYHNTSTPPRWLLNLTFSYMARITCMRSLTSSHSFPATGDIKTTLTTNCLEPDVTADHVHGTEAVSSRTLDFQPTIYEKCVCTHVEGAPLTGSDEFELSVQRAMIAIRSLTRCINAKMESKALQRRNEDLWHDIAHVFDRVFFIVYLSMTFIACAVLLGIYPQTGPNTVETIDVDKEMTYDME